MRILLDENFNNNVLRGLLHHNPDLDIIRAQDVPEIAAHEDHLVLEWAAEQGRVLLTHDVRTVTKYAYERIAAGLPLPGVIEVNRYVPIGVVVEDLILLIEAGNPSDVENQVTYLPLKKSK